MPPAPESPVTRSTDLPEEIAALTPRGQGHQFVLYGDSCSGVPGALHEATFAGVNAVVARLRPRPDFIVFPGDEVVGLTTDADALRAQWRHWLEVEMAWLDRTAVPLYHTTANHTTYDAMSEAVFAEMLPHLPRNGPPGQEGLSYFVRRGDLLLVFVHTSWSGLGGEGHVETDWLRATLAAHADARFKFVVGHHPVFPVNGFSGAYQREIGREHGEAFWRILVEQGVFAYLCSHILAFDVQVHDGVLQLLTAGAGTAHRMPEESEYLHCVQAALDDEGLRYQVLDRTGQVRERLSWPPQLPPSPAWHAVVEGAQSAAPAAEAQMAAWRLSGCAAGADCGPAQTLIAAWDEDAALPALWIGLTGRDQKLTVILGAAPGRSPHSWIGPALAPDQAFDLQVAIHRGMGPGGVLWRADDDAPWSSFASPSAWGPERLRWPAIWRIGVGKGDDDRRFLGSGLSVATAVADAR